MLTTLPPSRVVVKKSENLNFLEVSGPLQACNGIALLLPFNYMVLVYICLVLLIFLLDAHIILFIYPRLK
jgi:hypothetical protein